MAAAAAAAAGKRANWQHIKFLIKMPDMTASLLASGSYQIKCKKIRFHWQSFLSTESSSVFQH